MKLTEVSLHSAEKTPDPQLVWYGVREVAIAPFIEG